MKCEKCGFDSERAELFFSTRSSFGSRTRIICPACFAAYESNAHIVFFWQFLATLLVAVLLTLGLPSLSFGPWLLNFALLLVFIFIGTVIHELGHVCAGHLAGFRIFGIEIGRSRVISEFLFGGLRWQFRYILLGGCVHGAPPDTKFYKSRQSLFILGGPFANIILILISVWALPVDEAIDSGKFKGCAPALMFLLSNASLLIYSLWPHRFESRFGKIPNDILLLWETWRRPQAQVEQLPAHRSYLEAQECQRQGDYAVAKNWIEKALNYYPSNYTLEWLQAANLIGLKCYEEARAAYLQLLDRYGQSEELRCMVFNSIAYVDILAEDARLLDEAEGHSRFAYEKHPENVYFKGTRGIVLMKTGQYEQGMILLLQALKQHTERREQALDACLIAIAEAQRGKLEESRNFFSMARKLDPKCFLLEREPKAG